MTKKGGDWVKVHLNVEETGRHFWSSTDKVCEGFK